MLIASLTHRYRLEAMHSGKSWVQLVLLDTNKYEYWRMRIAYTLIETKQLGIRALFIDKLKAEVKELKYA